MALIQEDVAVATPVVATTIAQGSCQSEHEKAARGTIDNAAFNRNKRTDVAFPVQNGHPWFFRRGSRRAMCCFNLQALSKLISGRTRVHPRSARAKSHGEHGSSFSTNCVTNPQSRNSRCFWIVAIKHISLPLTPLRAMQLT